MPEGVLSRPFAKNKNNFDQWFGPNPVTVAT